jgi:acyl transferase domain-containing protein/acyl carrier protein
MDDTAHRAIAVVGVGAILPDAPNVAAFWQNITDGRYSITEITADRWDPELYYDPDPKAPDKTYSKIGGWVRSWEWDPLGWGLPIPPRVSDAMDDGQKWAVACTRAALADYGYPQRGLDPDRMAVILGNAMAGEKHYLTALRIYFPEYAAELAAAPSFSHLPADVRRAIAAEMHAGVGKRFPEITEDTMPGELSNCIAGRIANLFNFHGPNYVVDAACASAMAAINAAMEGLAAHDYDSVIAGGIDRNMGASSFIKFCKIGALSATGTRPYADGADGFVMGEGAAVFLLKRLADAERDGDRIYAVIRGIGGSSDGKGKGITAPNPTGQRLAVERAWQNAGLSPATATLIEGHGTSTRVGDVVEVESLAHVFDANGARSRSIALGSVKSNIGHLKGAAGAAGLLKAVLALHEKILPPSLHFERPNPSIDFEHSPFFVNTTLAPWEVPGDGVRRAGLSAFGFGGTNFHMVLEEYVPGRLVSERGGRDARRPPPGDAPSAAVPTGAKAPLRGALVIGAASGEALAQRVRTALQEAKAGRAPEPRPPDEADLRAPERLAIDYGDAAELAERASKALQALSTHNPAVWKALRAQGVFRGSGPAPKVAFLYTGQGSQYANMLHELKAREPLVRTVVAEADAVMTPLLGRPLSDYIFVDASDPAAVAAAEDHLRQTAITQPAVLTVDNALTRLLAAYGIVPDIVMGHSLGEYGALVAADALPFPDALEAVSARGREMSHLSVEDNGMMAAVFGPLPEIERIVSTIDGYVVIANVNSKTQAVIGGATAAVQRAIDAVVGAGLTAVPLPVSHAFHTAIVAPASEPLRRTLQRLHLRPPSIPIVANVNGELYPMGPGVEAQMLDILARQVAAPVQFVKGLHTLYTAGARCFVEVGPKRALHGFVEDVLGSDPDVIALFTNHPKLGDTLAFNQALCGLYAAGLGVGTRAERGTATVPATAAPRPATAARLVPAESAASLPNDRYSELGRLFAEFLDRGLQIVGSVPQEARRAPLDTPVAITGAALGLPGTEHVFDDANITHLLDGQQCIDVVPTRFRRAMLEKHITRLIKSDAGGPRFEVIANSADVIKLAGRGGRFDLGAEFGISAERVPALDITTRLAIAAGIDALRDAGIPLVMHYRTTSKGTRLPDRWMLPEALRDDTGIIFASAFPGYDALVADVTRYHADRARHEQLEFLEHLRGRLPQAAGNGNDVVRADLDHRIHELRTAIETEPYVFDRRFLFRILSMGHSQFAELIGARGPNTQVNAACASTTQAVALAEDWIRIGRCRRVLVISADDFTSDNLLEWTASGFLATGAAATDDIVEEAALPFDRRRHGMIIGMGAAALVVESAAAARERGIQPICEVLSTVTANSAFHGTRLDVDHICRIMEQLVGNAEARWGIRRERIAAQTVFVSHETYTPARGGSAAAEVHALRQVFGAAAAQIVVANTKGFTGHAMGAGIEDVLAVKALETGIVPPVANFREEDPDLGPLNLSRGGSYPIEYGLRLGAGFGSQICMTLVRRVPTDDGMRPSPDALGYAYRVTDPAAWETWLQRISGSAQAQLEVVDRTLRIRDAADRREPAVGGVDRAASRQTADSAPPMPAVGTPEQPTAGSPRPAPPLRADAVKERILALFAEKSGYPPDMLDPDLDLEADLGIDTVKQAELFAAIREEYGIPRDDTLKLRDFPTLAHVVRFVYERRPDLAAGRPAADHVEPRPAPASGRASTADRGQPADAVRARVLALFAEKTGYPPDMLDPELDLEADLGIDTVKQAEMFAAIRAEYGIARDDTLKLRDFPTLAHVIQFVRQRRPDLAAAGASAAPAPASVEHEQPAVAAAPSDPVKDRVLALFADKTGYPPDMLDPELDLEADLGIDTVKQAEMFAAIRAEYGIARDDTLKLRDFPTLAHVIQFVHQRRPDLGAGRVTTGRAAPAPSSGEQPAAAAGSPSDPVKDRVLALFAAKTGYPPDMLDPSLDLEADLGIDTVKQAEMFAAIREEYGIARDDTLKLRDFPTLDHVIGFVHQRRPDLASSAARQPQAAAHHDTSADQPLPGAAPLSTAAADRIPRRVPVPSPRPPLALCKPTGVTLGASSRVIVMPDAGGVAEALAERLAQLGVEALVLDPAEDAAALTQRLQTCIATGPIQGVYWLPALDHEGDLRSMDLTTWHAALRVRIKLLYAAMRTLYDQVAGPGSFLVTATRLGGQHGYDAAGAVAPLGGATVGFTKTYKRERSEALVKAVDFEAPCAPGDVAALLIDETVMDPGVVEVGYHGGTRWTVGLLECPAADGAPGLTLDRDSVFVVTGAAGSIVSAIVADLAAASGGTFYLLDKVPVPDPASVDLQRFVADKDGLKRDIFDRLKARGERATPALVERELAGLERAHAALSAIQAVGAAGGTAHYYSVDLTDPEGVSSVVAGVRRSNGHIDVLLHAAGLEISHFLPDKEPREFDLVFDVKSDGWFNLLHAIGDMPVGATVVFSSIAGRFGNGGQADYSAANDLLCKTTSSFRTMRPGTRGIAIDWTAWGGIGMASRGSIPKMMEVAGIDMLPPEAGIPVIRRELAAGGTRGEVVIAQRLGILLHEWDGTGGLDRTVVTAVRGAPSGPMIGSILGMGVHTGLTAETLLDPAKQPFLHDHQIDGTPVLPGVMGIEAFAELALAVFPDWHIAAIENVDFLAPFKFYRHEPRTLTLNTTFRADGDAVVADCRLLGSRILPNQAEPQVTVHFTAQVRLARSAPAPTTMAAPNGVPANRVALGDIYRIYFHGPAYQVLESAWSDGGHAVGLMAPSLPDNHIPSDLSTVTAPRLIELCFQTAGVWQLGTTGVMALPQHVDRIEPVRGADAASARFYAVIAPRGDGGAVDAHVVDADGNVYVTLRGYQTVPLPATVDADRLAPLKRAMQ